MKGGGWEVAGGWVAVLSSLSHPLVLHRAKTGHLTQTGCLGTVQTLQQALVVGVAVVRV